MNTPTQLHNAVHELLPSRGGCFVKQRPIMMTNATFTQVGIVDIVVYKRDLLTGEGIKDVYGKSIET